MLQIIRIFTFFLSLLFVLILLIKMLIMIRYIILFIFFFSFNTRMFSQSGINLNHRYNISAVLNPDSKELDVDMTLLYINKTGVDLEEIYFYTYANSYVGSSDFAKYLLDEGDAALYMLPGDKSGGYKDLAIYSGEKKLAWEYTDKDKEICKVHLPFVLYKGEKINLKIKYRLKIPQYVFDLGYKDGLFNMVKWYPQPVIFDKGKWRIVKNNTGNMFYYDFGDYNVKISYPQGYNIAAPGNGKEKKLNKQNNSLNAFNISVFKISNIKEFVFVAMKGYQFKQETLHLKDRTIPVFVYYQGKYIRKKNLEQLTKLVTGSLECLSSKGADYPYDVLYIVLSRTFKNVASYPAVFELNMRYYTEDESLRAGEIVSSLFNMVFDNVKINRYKEPWLIDGMSFYYAAKCIEELYKNKELVLPFGAPSLKCYASAGIKLEKKIKPCSLPYSGYDNKEDYRYNIEHKIAPSFNYLADYLGEDLFDEIMLDFFDKRKYEFVDKKYFKKAIEEETGQNLDWFFEGMLNADKQGFYQIDKVTKGDSVYVLEIKNNSEYAIPFDIGTIKDGEVFNSNSYDGFTGNKTIEFPVEGVEDMLELDPFDLFPLCLKVQEGKIYINKSIKRRKKYSFFSLLGPSNFILPIAGFNKPDGFMAGLSLMSINKVKNKYFVNALYGFKSKTVVGEANYKYVFYRDGYVKKIALGVNGRRFTALRRDSFALQYWRITPYIKMKLRSGQNYRHWLHYRFSYISDEHKQRIGKKSYQRYLTALDYEYRNTNLVAPVKAKVGLEYQNYNYPYDGQYVKISGMVKYAYMYKLDRYISIRLYGATYLYNSNKNSTATLPGTLGLIGNGANDYGYDYFYIDRSAQDGFWSRQLYMNTGGFKTAVSSAYGLGQSNNYVAALNLVMDLPVKTGIKPYFDFGVYGYLPTISEGYKRQTMYSGGLMWQIFKDNLEIYLPLVNSKEIADFYKNEDNFFSRISFMLNLDFFKLMGMK